MPLKSKTTAIPPTDLFVDVEVSCPDHPDFKTMVRLNKVDVDKAWKEKKPFTGTYSYCSYGCLIEFEVFPGT